MPAANVRNPLLAQWPPAPHTRQYFLSSASAAVEVEKRGKELPAKSIVGNFSQKGEPEFHERMLDSTRLFTNLPVKFFDKYLMVQKSENPIILPRIMENKNVTVRSCFLKHPAFNDPSGPLHIQHWDALGWPSQQAYEEWLNTSMLFAFAHCFHYCSAPRVFDVDGEKNKSSESMFYFKQVMADPLSIGKKTNILSVTGFEYRNFNGDIQSTLLDVKEHSRVTMEQILAVAAQTHTTDIVLIPYGMGVFIPRNQDGDNIKQATFAGMIEALNKYKGPQITLHCCGWQGFHDVLASANNKNICFEDKTGYDAYTVANEIQDRGDAGEKQQSVMQKPLKSMLINAADNDWTALLDPGKSPGQFSDNHTLYHTTSDEYYAIVMCFAYFSIQRMIDFFENCFGNKIIQVNEQSTTPHELKTIQSEIATQKENGEGIQQEELYHKSVASSISKIDGILGTLRDKINQIDHNLPEAAERATILLKSLEQCRNKYHAALLKEPRGDAKKAGQQFNIDCNAAIDEAKPVLERDLNWGEYLGNLVKALANAIVWLVSIGNSNSFFPYKKSASIEAVEEAEQNLKLNNL
ncbi:hypothetical protein [Legionella fallonii]|uniref:Uncharacterized protein n=1 Tax=Legionella fallonii LLAP-10 TaxID=1212491 RepID=A0A098G937_9GAMM|nr:hypothetical protein [Legionella fallonii]CEG59014.1 conserved protein of unknown function [Legionella fallonii LLAP-10]